MFTCSINPNMLVLEESRMPVIRDGKPFVIYALVCPLTLEVKYVGQTVDLEQRTRGKTQSSRTHRGRGADRRTASRWFRRMRSSHCTAQCAAAVSSSWSSSSFTCSMMPSQRTVKLTVTPSVAGGCSRCQRGGSKHRLRAGHVMLVIITPHPEKWHS